MIACYFNVTFFKKRNNTTLNSFIFLIVILRPTFCIYKEENIIYFLIIYLQDATRKFGDTIN